MQKLKPLLIAVFLLSATASASFCQPPAQPDYQAVVSETPLTQPAVTEISVDGNQLIATEAILARIEIKIGDEFDRDRGLRDLRSIYKMGYFSARSLQCIPEATADGGIRLIYRVEEKQFIVADCTTSSKIPILCAGEYPTSLLSHFMNKDHLPYTDSLTVSYPSLYRGPFTDFRLDGLNKPGNQREFYELLSRVPLTIATRADFAQPSQIDHGQSAKAGTSATNSGGAGNLITVATNGSSSSAGWVEPRTGPFPNYHFGGRARYNGPNHGPFANFQVQGMDEFRGNRYLSDVLSPGSYPKLAVPIRPIRNCMDAAHITPANHLEILRKQKAVGDFEKECQRSDTYTL